MIKKTQNLGINTMPLNHLECICHMWLESNINITQWEYHWLLHFQNNTSFFACMNVTIKKVMLYIVNQENFIVKNFSLLVVLTKIKNN